MSMERKGLQPKDGEAMADLTDFMNDWFFGSVKPNRRAYDLTGTSVKKEEEHVHGKSSTSRLTQEWLEEAKKMVAASPARHGSPSRLGVSPRFAAASSQTREPSALLDRRDPLSRSARRHRSTDGIGDEILQRTSARHGRNKSESFACPLDSSEPQTLTSAADHHHPQHLSDDPRDRQPPGLLSKHPLHRKSRFHEKPPEPHPSASPSRTFWNPSPVPPPAAVEPNEQGLLLSPPRNLVESAHRRSVSSSTCSLDKISRVDGFGYGRSASTSSEAGELRSVAEEDARQLNAFLRRQKAMIAKISRGELSAKAQIILSGSSNSTTSSMVAAICYAWLLENREKEQGGSGAVVPVVSIKRGRMLKQKQAAWLFFHLGIDASALLFSDEVDLESLIMARQLSILVIGQDVLKTNGEVGSQCTVLTDNYCEEAYDLLETPNLKKLLLAGILLDTHNLNGATKFFTNRDAEAVQLLLVGSAPSLRHELFEQLMQDHKESTFLEVLRQNYGKPSNDDNYGSGESHEQRTSTRKLASISPHEVDIPRTAKQQATPAPAPAPTPPVKAQEIASHGKNKFFLAKWFSFGSK